jgi:hypothetical protein
MLVAGPVLTVLTVLTSIILCNIQRDAFSDRFSAQKHTSEAPKVIYDSGALRKQSDTLRVYVSDMTIVYEVALGQDQHQL